jgi:hypothetical protein
VTSAPEGLEGVKAHYRSGADTLADDFFGPCLRHATLYRRASGYFSSTALLSWVSALPRLIQENDLKILLIASPELSPQDISILKDLDDEVKRAAYQTILVDRLLEHVLTLIDNPDAAGARAQLFAWLLATGKLEIRFAFAGHIDGAGIFHEKIGVFDFAGGKQIAFTGSAN